MSLHRRRGRSSLRRASRCVSVFGPDSSVRADAARDCCERLPRFRPPCRPVGPACRRRCCCFSFSANRRRLAQVSTTPQRRRSAIPPRLSARADSGQHRRNCGRPASVIVVNHVKAKSLAHLLTDIACQSGSLPASHLSAISLSVCQVCVCSVRRQSRPGASVSACFC